VKAYNKEYKAQRSGSCINMVIQTRLETKEKHHLLVRKIGRERYEVVITPRGILRVAL
jgi:ADP-heptose:LPS heptosyltransferase